MARKEIEKRRQSSEEQAREQVESYIEKVEKKPEIDEDDQTGMKKGADDVQMPAQITDDDDQVVAESVDEEPKIDLPLTEEEVREGLHHKIADSVKWLSEWCVYVIKKYPGRVFYKEE